MTPPSESTSPPKGTGKTSSQRDDYRERLEPLFHLVDKELSPLVDLERLLERMFDHLMEFFGAERGMILLSNQSTKKLEVVLSRPAEAQEQPFSQTVARRAFNQKGPILIPDVSAEHSVPTVSLVRHEVQSVLAAPLLLESEPIGVIYLDSRKHGLGYSEQDLALLDRFCEHVSRAVGWAHEKDTLRKSIDRLSTLAAESGKSSGELVFVSARMREIFELVEELAAQEVTTLIIGESGVGKELVARALHKSSPRAQKPFVAVNCAALTPSLVESELFGHEKGAFTGADRPRPGRFEQADGGTLFLDEIGELNPDVQAKLLRVLQEREVDRIGGARPIPVNIRLVAATNRELKEMVKEGKFREDLYYRLHVFQLDIPPLRARPDDVPVLARAFLESLAPQLRKSIKTFDAEALDALSAYSWPGNVRELRNVIERALVLEKSPTIRLGSLPADIAYPGGRGSLRPEPAGATRPDQAVALLPGPIVTVPAGTSTETTPAGNTVPSPGSGSASYAGTLSDARASFERDYLIKALVENRNNVSVTARELGVSRKTLYAKMEAYGIDIFDKKS